MATLRLLSSLLLVSFVWTPPPAQAASDYRKPVDLKLLILATDGKEAGLSALREFLEYSGTPFDVVKLAAGEPLPQLSQGDQGRYQGIILTLGNLGFCNPDCRSALDPDGWARLDAYTRDFGVRTLSYYTFPEPRYGLSYTAGVSTSDEAPLTAEFTAAAEPVFRDLRTSSPVRITHAFAYRAKPLAAEGERTIPLLTSGPDVLAVLHEKADGRESIALTFDNNPTLLHSLTLQGGLIDWLTRGVRLGWRKAWLMPQVDDLFLPNYLFDSSMPECATAGGPIVAPGVEIPCVKLRIDGNDLEAVAQWQDSWRAKPQFAGLRVAMAYNGFGVKAEEDPLLAAARTRRNDFFWVSHTHTHRHLDCYAPVEDGCRGANAAEARIEIANNRQAAADFGLELDAPSLVTPQISGLNNARFLEGAASEGIRYLVSDTSRPEFLPAKPNMVKPSDLQTGIFFIPRRPTAIFYNASDGAPRKPGSEPDEYNFLFGPGGQFRRTDGSPFHASEQDYEAIVDRDRDLTLKYMLRGEMYPLMFHQANLWRYQGSRTLMTDLLESTMASFESISRLPVLSVSQSRLGQLLEERLGYWQAGVKATLVPGGYVKITAERPAVVPVTGVCEASCEAYGPFHVASVAIPAGETREFKIVAPPQK